MDNRQLKQRLGGLRVPTADREQQEAALRESLRAFRVGDQQVRPDVWTWRDWLWPSPFVWSGFALLWLVMILRLTSDPAAPADAPQLAGEAPRVISTPSVLLARDDLRALLREFEIEGRTP